MREGSVGEGASEDRGGTDGKGARALYGSFRRAWSLLRAGSGGGGIALVFECVTGDGEARLGRGGGGPSPLISGLGVANEVSALGRGGGGEGTGPRD